MKTTKSRTTKHLTAVQRTADPKARKIVNNSFFSKDDPNGSYTGTPSDGGMPVQDADDL